MLFHPNHICLGRINRPDRGPPEPYRSQSAAIKPQRYRPESRENDTNNHPPSSMNAATSARKQSTEQRHSTSRSAGGRAKSSRPFREIIRSAVPESSIITIAKRPDRGGTSKSQPVDNLLVTNSSLSSGSKVDTLDQSFQMSHSTNIEMPSV